MWTADPTMAAELAEREGRLAAERGRDDESAFDCEIGALAGALNGAQ